MTEAAAREIIVETSKVKAVFSNRGGTVVHWILKEFRSDKGEPLDLIPQGAGANAIRPTSFSYGPAAPKDCPPATGVRDVTVTLVTSPEAERG